MILYHYCSNEAFHSIISNKEIRLSSLSLSNDCMEGKFIESVLFKMAEKDGLDEKTMMGLQKEVSRFISKIDGLGFCLSEKEDLLSQWRGYANDAQGVSIGFSKKYFRLLSDSQKGGETSGFYLKKVIYKLDKQESALIPAYQKLKEYIGSESYSSIGRGLSILIRSKEETKKVDKKTQQTTHIFALLDSLIPLIGDIFSLKSTAFKEEFEWRLISLLSKFTNASPDPCLFHPCINKIKPYRSFRLIELEVNPIEKIVLGPKNSTPKDVIESFLQQNNFNNVEVLSSKASYT